MVLERAKRAVLKDEIDIKFALSDLVDAHNLRVIHLVKHLNFIALQVSDKLRATPKSLLIDPLDTDYIACLTVPGDENLVMLLAFTRLEE